MKRWIHKATYNVIYKDCVEHGCPNYNDDLAIALKDLTQDKQNSNRNSICMNV